MPRAEARGSLLKIKKGWMVKGGKKEPSTRSLYRLKGIKNADPLSESLGRGRWMAKEGRDTIHRSQRIHVWLSLISKKVGKKKCYTLVVEL